MSGSKNQNKNHFAHLYIGDGQNPKAYRLNDYEYDLLLEIQEVEMMDTESETIRFIIREAARKRNIPRPE